ncbi:MAG: G8 domain-containing protein [Planctomycetia bacterium]|nr:G8 domain-containing protein [Planctomycetia bacterium]
MLKVISTVVVLAFSTVTIAAESVSFQARTVQSGSWSDKSTWESGRAPQAGDFVQVRAGHAVTYDVHSSVALRMVHVAGTLSFSRTMSTLMDVGLLKIEPGETTTEDGFDCHAAPVAAPKGSHGHSHSQVAAMPPPALEIGTPAEPIPAGIQATIRLRYHAGTNKETLPAIIACGGRWDVHGAPLARTWLKLAAAAKPGDARITLEQAPADWRVGDRIIVTTGVANGPGPFATFRKSGGRPKPVGTEERVITAVEGTVLLLNQPLEKSHVGDGFKRSEVANLSRNVVIESAQTAGERGHTMYHFGSSGGISYAEFRHLGKEGVLGKYPIHFHLVRDTMRGSGVLGASVWDSHNRWITVHGTDHLLIRDCVGYQSLGHGYFLEDATEQWNVFDRNLAVQAFNTTPLPRQVLPYDPNDGAGFWWANGRNTFVRNAACENDHYGYHFQVAAAGGFDPVLTLLGPDGTTAKRDVRRIPLLRFEDNESHGEGLYDFRFGDETDLGVAGDREHPFIVRRLKAWDSHYVIRPNVRYFLLEGLMAENAAFGIYHPNYDEHVYRDVALANVKQEPLNGGHDEESLARGNYTFERLTLTASKLKNDPLIQLTGIGIKPDLFGHFRNVLTASSSSNSGGIVDFGGGPRTNRVENCVAYYFHDTPKSGTTMRVAPVKAKELLKTGNYQSIAGWTGPDALAAEVNVGDFPKLVKPVDDLPPATLITGVERAGDKCVVRGVAHDDGEIAAVTVNGLPATIIAQQAGVADWTITLDAPSDGRYVAQAKDLAGNQESMTHTLTSQADR